MSRDDPPETKPCMSDLTLYDYSSSSSNNEKTKGAGLCSKKTKEIWSGTLVSIVENLDPCGTHMNYNWNILDCSISTKLVPMNASSGESSEVMVPEVTSGGRWPSLLKMRTMEKCELQAILQKYAVHDYLGEGNVTIVQFSFVSNGSKEASSNFIGLQMQLCSGCGILSLGSVKNEQRWSSYLESDVCLVLYSRKQKGYFGLIPRDQGGFKACLLQELREPLDAQLFDVTVAELMND